VVVVVARTEAQPEHEPPAGEVLHRRGLLGEDRRAAQRREDDRRGEADALGDGGDRREGHERLVAVVDDPVERAQGREALAFCRAPEVHELLGGDAG
jgi:hypothetical protein